MFLLLDKLRGKSGKLSNWLLFRKLEIFKNEAHNSERVTNFMYFAAMVYLIMPIFILVLWSLLIVYDNHQDEQPVTAGICIFIVGLAIILFVASILKVKWNNFRFKLSNMILMIASLILITIYQVLVVFGYEYDDKFFPYSALFLNFNVFILSIAMFLSKFDKNSDLKSIFDRAFPKRDVEIDSQRVGDLAQEINQQQKDPNWKCSHEDLCDVITIGKVSQQKMNDAFGGGFQQKFNNMNKMARLGIEIGLVIFSLLILAAYSFFIYSDGDRKSKMGIITSVSVTLMDAFNMLLFHSSFVTTPGGIIFLFVFNRIIMVSLGEQFWFYGYIALYFLYSMTFVWLISKNRFPFEGDIVRKGAKLKNLISKEGSKDTIEELKEKGIRNPIILLAILTVLYFIMICIISFVNIEGVTVAPIKIYYVSNEGKLIQNEKELQFYVVALLSIFLIGCLYFAISFYRIVIRKATRLEIYDHKSVTSCFKDNGYLQLVNVFLILTFIAAVFWSLFWFWYSDKGAVLYIGIFGSASFLSYVMAYLYFMLNEYDYFQDVEKVNRHIDRHNDNITKMEKKREEIQEKLLNGTIKLPSLNSATIEAIEVGQMPITPATDIKVPQDNEVEMDQINQKDEEEGAPQNNEQELADQKKMMEEIFKKNEEKKRKEEEERQRLLAENAEQRQNQEEENKKMEEQMKKEKEIIQQRKIEAAEQRRIQAIENAKKQAEDEKRRREEAAKQPAVDNKPSSVYNFHGKIGEGTIIQNNKAFKDDEMYDGGENEEEIVDNQANSDQGGRMTNLETLEDFENCLNKDGPICVVFTDRSNTVCMKLAQEIEALQEEFKATTFFKVDILENNQAGVESEIEILPTFKCFRKGCELEKYEGEKMDFVREMITKHQKSDSEAPPAQNDPNAEYIDMDIAEQLGHFEKMAKCRFRRVPDWKIRDLGLFEAYRTQQMRPNDQKFLNSILFGTISYIIMTVCVMIDIKSFKGIIIVLPAVYIGVCFLIGSSVIYQSRGLRTTELVFWISFNVLYLILGAAYFYVTLSPKELVLFSNKPNPLNFAAGTFIFYYIIVPPTFIHGLMFVLKSIDRGFIATWKEGLFKGFLIVFIIGIVAEILNNFLFLTITMGVIYLFISIMLVYGAAQLWSYASNDYTMNQNWKIVNVCVCILIVLATTIFSLVDESLNTFEGLSYSSCVLLFLLWSYALIQFAIDFNSSMTRPVFFSASLFPIYKYDPKINNVREHYGPTVSWIAGSFLILMWSLCSSFAIEPVWFGVIFCIGIQLMIMISGVYLISITKKTISSTHQLIDEQTSKRAWIETKLSYFKQKGAFTRQDLLSYREYWLRRFHIHNYIAILTQGEQKKLTPYDSLYEEVQKQTNLKSYYRDQVESFLPDAIEIDSIPDLNAYFFELDHLQHDAYMEEIEQIVQFTMISVQNVLVWQHQQKKEFFQFLKSVKDIMYALDLNIQVPSKGSIDQRYSQVMDQVDDLDEQQKKVFLQLKLYYKQKQDKMLNISKNVKEEQQRKINEREQQAALLQQEKEDMLRKLKEEEVMSKLNLEAQKRVLEMREKEEELLKKKREEQMEAERLRLQEVARIAEAKQLELQHKQELDHQQFLIKQQELRQQELERKRQEMERVRIAQEQQRKLEAEHAAQQKAIAEYIASNQSQNNNADNGGEKIDINRNIDRMPDCWLKYKIIVERGRQKNIKFKDTQFTPTDKSIGQECLDNFPGQKFIWKSLSDKQGVFKGTAYKFKNKNYSIFKDGVDVNDIQQGELGDCYYLSALAVLGNQQTRDKFMFLNDENEWLQCGAFCIKFYNNGKEDIVIVDDYFPFKNGDYPFVNSGDKTELWPTILEKAFAKKYGSYALIEGGMVHLALAELTNGIPEKIDIDKSTNTTKLYEKLFALQKEDIFFGAGSPSHPDGDRAKSNTGIVQGHAYSILKFVKVDNLKLVCVRNPWGQGEWKGDWSDDSELWTKRIQNICGQNSFAEDGIFWMDFNDFCHEFDEVYICRNYSASKAWKNVLIEGSWSGAYAEGLPNAENRNAKMEKNPQYGITINGPGKGYVVFRLAEKKNAYTANQYGYLNIQANENGNLIRQTQKSKEIITQGPRNHPCQSGEIEFGDNLSYPYTFSAICANMNKGEQGKGNFSVQIFTKDMNMSVRPLN